MNKQDHQGSAKQKGRVRHYTVYPADHQGDYVTAQCLKYRAPVKLTPNCPSARVKEQLRQLLHTKGQPLRRLCLEETHDT